MCNDDVWPVFFPNPAHVNDQFPVSIFFAKSSQHFFLNINGLDPRPSNMSKLIKIQMKCETKEEKNKQMKKTDGFEREDFGVAMLNVRSV